MKKLGYGFPGQSDLQGHRRSDGKCFYIEVKLEDGEIRPEQREFIKAMRESNALAGFARSVEDALRIVFPEKYK